MECVLFSGFKSMLNQYRVQKDMLAITSMNSLVYEIKKKYAVNKC